MRESARPSEVTALREIARLTRAMPMRFVGRWSTLFLLLAGCGGGPLGLGWAPRTPDVLLRVPEEVTVSEASLHLETYLWRDFMPVTTPEGRPLIAVLVLASVSGAPIPDGLVADSVWVVYGEQVWASSAVEEEPRPPGSPSLVVVARDGPLWDPGVEVDVVLGLRDSLGGRFLVRASRQLIHRTD